MTTWGAQVTERRNRTDDRYDSNLLHLVASRGATRFTLGDVKHAANQRERRRFVRCRMDTRSEPNVQRPAWTHLPYIARRSGEREEKIAGFAGR